MNLVDPNARQALEKMKSEISKEIASRIYNGGTIGGRMTQRLVEMGEQELIKRTNNFKEGKS